MAAPGIQSPIVVGSVADLGASPRLFANPLLDKLSRVHWSMPLIVYTPFVALLAWLSFRALQPTIIVGASLLGYVIWTLVEYFGHRYLFHFVFPGRLGIRIHFLIHGVHHDHPNDPLRLVMPPLLSAPIMAVALLVALVLFGRPLAYPTLMGFMLGYLLYDMLHYSVHHAEFKRRPGRYLKRLHMLHHFHDPECGFGISAPWWDKAFKTEYSRSRRPTGERT